MVTLKTIHRCVVAVALLVCLVAVVGCETPNYPAVAARLDGAVAAGELSAQQGEELKGMLHLFAFEDQVNSLDEFDVAGRATMVGCAIKTAMEADELSPRMAWAIWDDYKEFDIAPRLKAAVDADAMTEEAAIGLWMQIAQAEQRELMHLVSVKLAEAVERGEITEEQAREVYMAMLADDGLEMGEACRGGRGGRSGCGRDKGDLVKAYARIGIDADTLGRVKQALMERGIGEDQAEPVLRGMLRMVHMMKKAEGEFEMNPRMAAYFTDEVGLDAEQMDIVTGMARRIAATCSRGESECDDKPAGECGDKPAGGCEAQEAAPATPLQPARPCQR